MSKILIVDDDVRLSNELASTLKQHGWNVECAGTAGDGWQFINNFQFDFVLLDWSLPDMTGLELCRKVRSAGNTTPIMFLTGRDAIEDKEAGLNAGGDDYLTKPFDVRELIARIKTIRRRPGRIVNDALSAGDVKLDPYLRTVSKGSESVQLSALESAILEYLLRNKNQFFSASQLFEAIWEPEADATDETVRVRMRVLRQKLSKIGSPDLVATVRGGGYVISDSEVSA